MKFKTFLLFVVFIQLTYPSEKNINHKSSPNKNKTIILNGIDILLDKYHSKIKGFSLALVTNQTGIDKNGIPNFERLMELEDVHLKIIFSPEHGLFGEKVAGQELSYTNIILNFPKVFSLYNNTKKPTPEMLTGIDLILYDIQDIGARFYTYISTLGLVMETAGELGIPIWILDRPNPISGIQIEGPILDITHKSFVGYYPIPIRYGLTVGELGTMIISEKWIDPAPELTVILMEGWNRNLWFDETDLIWISPSPNIPDLETAILYPGTCLLEGTNISEGRGTLHPFKWIGAPWIDGETLSKELNKKNLPGVLFNPIVFTPVDIPGKALNPKYNNKTCFGVEIMIINRDFYESVRVGIQILSVINELYPTMIKYKPFLIKLWGSDELPAHIKTKASTNQLIDSIKEKLRIVNYTEYFQY